MYFILNSCSNTPYIAIPDGWFDISWIFEWIFHFPLGITNLNTGYNTSVQVSINNIIIVKMQNANIALNFLNCKNEFKNRKKNLNLIDRRIIIFFADSLHFVLFLINDSLRRVKKFVPIQYTSKGNEKKKQLNSSFRKKELHSIIISI